MDVQTNGVAKHCRNEPHIEPTQRLVVETIRLKRFHSQQRQTAPDTGMLPLLIFICYPTQHNLVNREKPYYCRRTALLSARADIILPFLC